MILLLILADRDFKAAFINIIKLVKILALGVNSLGISEQKSKLYKRAK